MHVKLVVKIWGMNFLDDTYPFFFFFFAMLKHNLIENCSISEFELETSIFSLFNSF